jgi:acetyl esterase/lipase
MEWPGPSEYVSWRMAEWAGLVRLGTAMRLAGRDGVLPLVRESIVFGDHLEQRLELAVPGPGAIGTPQAGHAAGAEPTAALFVHGGSWRSGSPEDYRFAGNWFVSRGMPAGVTGYRHAPDHTWPAQRDDVLSAMRVVLELTGAARLLVAGHSAGAQLAAAAVYDRVARRAAGIPDQAIAGLVVLSGPLDFGVICPTRPACPMLGLLIGGDDDWDRADPSLLMRRGDPWPVLVMHGANDPIVNVSSSVRFAASASRGGSPVELVVPPTAGHATLLWAFLGDEALQAPVARFVDAYAGVSPDSRRALGANREGAAPTTDRPGKETA